MNILAIAQLWDALVKLFIHTCIPHYFDKNIHDRSKL